MDEGAIAPTRIDPRGVSTSAGNVPSRMVWFGVLIFGPSQCLTAQSMYKATKKGSSGAVNLKRALSLRLVFGVLATSVNGTVKGR